jgi:hypothetical protein
MNRILPLSLFLVRHLFLSLSGVVVPAAGLTFYLIAFRYGMDQAQFTTVAGVALGVLALLTALLLAGRAGRASFYPFFARLHRRGELLAAIVIASVAVTSVVAVLMTAAALLRHQLNLDWPSALWIIPTWLVLWTLTAALALPLASLTSRDGSHLLGYVLITALLVGNDRRWLLEQEGLRLLSGAVTVLLWPTTTLLAQASAGVHDRFYFLALAATLLYAALLFTLAVELFRHKDLIWPE